MQDHPHFKKSQMTMEKSQMPMNHPGFKKVQAGIAQETNPHTGQPYGPEVAGAILANKTRNASPAAKKANPNLKRVRG